MASGHQFENPKKLSAEQVQSVRNELESVIASDALTGSKEKPDLLDPLLVADGLSDAVGNVVRVILRRLLGRWGFGATGGGRRVAGPPNCGAGPFDLSAPVAYFERANALYLDAWLSPNAARRRFLRRRPWRWFKARGWATLETAHIFVHLMQVPDAEWLFDHVDVGTTVYIV